MKTKKEILALIEANNKAYASATKEERVIMVCEDAIKVLEDENSLIKAKPGSFISYPYTDGTEGIDTKITNDFDFDNKLSQFALLSNDTPQCTVCAKGMCILSKQRVGNSLEGIVNTHRSKNMDLLDDVFTPIELDILEVLFEDETFPWNDERIEDELSDLGILDEYGFVDKEMPYNHIRNSNEKLIAIYKDVIKSGGIVDFDLFTVLN